MNKREISREISVQHVQMILVQQAFHIHTAFANKDGPTFLGEKTCFVTAGDAGAQGVPGLTGAPGPQGFRGDSGDPGPKGKSTFS